MRTAEQTVPERAALIVTALVLAWAMFFSAQLAMQHDVRHILLRVVDDASYYLTTARNIADGHGMTFDGIHATNGFHPLWLLMLVPLFLVHGAPETMLRLVVLLQALLLTIAFLVLYRTQSSLFSRRVALASAICFVSLVFMQCLNGMESALFALLLVLLYARGLHLWRTRVSWQGALLFGVLLGLLLLSRLDMIFIPLAMFGCALPYVLNPATRARAIAVSVTAGVATAVVVAPYLLFNLAEFGSFMPISGALKSSFPRIALSRATLAGIDHRNYAFAALAIAWVVWRLLRTGSPLTGPRDDYYAVSTSVLAWAVILHFLDTVLFMKWGVFAWHFVLYPLFAVLTFGGVFDALLRWRVVHARPAVYWLGIAIVAVIGARREYQRDAFPLDHIWHVASYNAAVWAREHTPADTVFAMRDAGHFAFFSERRVINLDGLVNDLDYQREIAAQRVGQYLRANHVEYLVLHALPGRGDVLRGDYDSLALNYVSHKYNVVSDDIVVHRRDEVYRSAPYFDGPDPAVCLIWSLADAPAEARVSSTP
jgi:hypothetical protein